jgi:23S rRNA (adenine2030-N6)-methyltransferase
LLSYRHAFHAGNHADVIKHLTLVLTLDYYRSKNKPFWYIDTHAGSGSYKLTGAEAQKTHEFAQGIQTLWSAKQIPNSVQTYLNLVKQLNPQQAQLHRYPGSPWLAAQMLHPTDAMRLFELHPTDFRALEKLFSDNKNTHVRKEDGLHGLVGLLPPITRRAITLIDPSYELKSDYSDVVSTLAKAHKRFATGTYLLWYPVISRQRVRQMINALQKTGIPDILQIEFCPAADTEGMGMTGSGLFVINPPWQLAKQMRDTLPWLMQHIANAGGHFTVQQITPEARL